jgi:glycosyltransferase involved in cell wall biosynthesis
LIQSSHTGACLLNKVSTVWETGSQQDLSILVLLATLNEEKGIGLTLAELKDYLPGSMILVVDGNSTDATVHAAKKHGVDIIFQEGKGKGDAVSSGLQNINSDFDYVVFIDADYTYPAQYIPEMIEILKANPKVGMVCGNRFNSQLHIGAMRDAFYFGNRLLSFVNDLVDGVDLCDPLSGLRVIRWNIIRSWRPESTGFDVEVELNHFVENQGYEIAEIEIPYRERVGEKKLKVIHGLIILRRIIIEFLRKGRGKK